MGNKNRVEKHDVLSQFIHTCEGGIYADFF